MKTGQEVMEEIEALIKRGMHSPASKEEQWPEPIVVQQAMMNIIVMFTRTKPEKRTSEEEFAELEALMGRAYEITDQSLTPTLRVV